MSPSRRGFFAAIAGVGIVPKPQSSVGITGKLTTGESIAKFKNGVLVGMRDSIRKCLSIPINHYYVDWWDCRRVPERDVS